MKLASLMKFDNGGTFGLNLYLPVSLHLWVMYNVHIHKYSRNTLTITCTLHPTIHLYTVLDVTHILSLVVIPHQ